MLGLKRNQLIECWNEGCGVELGAKFQWSQNEGVKCEGDNFGSMAHKFLNTKFHLVKQKGFWTSRKRIKGPKKSYVNMWFRMSSMQLLLYRFVKRGNEKSCMCFYYSCAS